MMFDNLLSIGTGSLASFTLSNVSSLCELDFLKTRLNNAQMQIINGADAKSIIEGKKLLIKSELVIRQNKTRSANFVLAHGVGVLAGNYFAKVLQEKCNLEDSQIKEVSRIGIIFTVTGIFTFYLTESIILSTINAVVTAIWQKIIPLKI